LKVRRMRKAFLSALSAAIFSALLTFLAPTANAQQVFAQEKAVQFVCSAPAGHVCQYTVRTGAGPISFSLPSGERRDIAGITPRSDTYCVCDPGPVTPDCKAPQLGHWCLGYWADVVPGLNTHNNASRFHFAQQ
jgi:hypothetical protein